MLCLAPYINIPLSCLGGWHNLPICATYFSLINVSPTHLPVSPADITMVICPGIGNHSEKHYIRTFVDYAQKDGYRCAVLNHLGALPNIELTSPRMFTYGETKDLILVHLEYWEMKLLPQKFVFILGVSRNNPVYRMKINKYLVLSVVRHHHFQFLLLFNCQVWFRLEKLWPAAVLIAVSTAEILVQSVFKN